VIATASDCGIRQFKLGYYHYRGFGHLRRQLDEVRRDLEGVERLCQQYGIQAGMHVHAGYCLSAEAMLVDKIVADFDPASLGIYADLGHMGLEGGYGGWVQSLDLISDRLIMLSLKNVGLFPYSDEDDSGRRSHVRPDFGDEGVGLTSPAKRWESKFVPLDQGITPYPEAFRYLKQIGYDNYACFHTEYQGAWSWRELTYPELIAQLKRDFAYVQSITDELGM
jgi:sugar phosphate isomerase/epimerase